MEKIPPKSNSLLRLLCCFVLLPINTHTRTYSISMLPEAKAVPPGIPQLLSTQSSQFGSPGPKPWNAFSSSSTQTSRPVSMSSYVFRNKMMNVRNPSHSPPVVIFTNPSAGTGAWDGLVPLSHHAHPSSTRTSCRCAGRTFGSRRCSSRKATAWHLGCGIRPMAGSPCRPMSRARPSSYADDHR